MPTTDSNGCLGQACLLHHKGGLACRIHLFPFRTESLNCTAPMVLHMRESRSLPSNGQVKCMSAHPVVPRLCNDKLQIIKLSIMMKIIRTIQQFGQSLIAQTIRQKMKWCFWIFLHLIHLGENIEHTTELCLMTASEQVEYYSESLAVQREREDEGKSILGAFE